MALAAKELMQKNSVLTLVVTDLDNRVCGAVQLYDILRVGI
jgi:predicted transcriptional regulator